MTQHNPNKMGHVMGLWMKHQSTVTAYVASVVRDRHHVEDVVQEVASAIAMQVDRYEVERPFLPWALGIAHNQIHKYLRTRRRDRLVFDDELLARRAAAHMEPAEGGAARKAALHDCIQRLSDERKKLLERRYFDRVAVQELADGLGRTQGAVSMLLLRMREQLANCIRKHLAADTVGRASGQPQHQPEGEA